MEETQDKKPSYPLNGIWFSARKDWQVPSGGEQGKKLQNYLIQ